MSKKLVFSVIRLVSLFAWMFAYPTLARADGSGCGDEALTCADDEKCVEHLVALFGEGGASGPPYKEGKCVPKSTKGSDFWCGPKHCQSGLFGTPSVCCIQQPVESSQAQYRCSYSELSCPGNTNQLHIRGGDVASIKLQD